jgi:hypothetical protein
MISAKIFENEEEVKTFKKHAKFCSRSIESLKDIELELLSKLNWNIDHSSIFDFGIYYFSNFLFLDKDLIYVSRSCTFEYNWIDFHTYVGSVLGLGSKEINNIREMFYNNRKMKKILNPIIQVQHLDKKDFNQISEVIFKNFFMILKSVQLKYALKSKIKIMLITYILIFLKEFFISKTYSTYQTFKEYLCSSVLK